MEFFTGLKNIRNNLTWKWQNFSTGLCSQVHYRIVKIKYSLLETLAVQRTDCLDDLKEKIGFLRDQAYQVPRSGAKSFLGRGQNHTAR